MPPDDRGDRRGGRDWPLYQTEQELGWLRMRSKLIATTNSYGIGAVANIVSTVVGPGFKYEVVSKEKLPDADPDAPGKQAPRGLDAELAKAQDLLDEFLARERWNAASDPFGDGALASTREQELVRRIVRDGEAVVRLFPKPDGRACVRFVEPAQVRNPPGVTEADGWLLGIQHEVGDEEKRLKYHVDYKSTEEAVRRGADAHGDDVPASEIVHFTGPDTDAVLKRGLPWFSFDTADAFERAVNCNRNASLGAAWRALTAEIWQHQFGTQDQISALAAGKADFIRTDPLTGRAEQVERQRPAQVRRVPAGQTVVQPPQDYTPQYLTAVQGDLRQGGAALVLPEYEISGDASNANYASTREAGTPKVRRSEGLQAYLVTGCVRVCWKVLRHAAESGLLSPATLDLIDVQVTPPQVVSRDDLQIAQANQIKVGLGVKSRQTCAMEDGLDWETEKANMQQEAQELGPQLPPLDLPGDGGAGGGGLPAPPAPRLAPDGAGRAPTSEGGPALADGLQERLDAILARLPQSAPAPAPPAQPAQPAVVVEQRHEQPRPVKTRRVVVRTDAATGLPLEVEEYHDYGEHRGGGERVRRGADGRVIETEARPEGETPYGFCPHCGAPGEARERRADGNDVCEAGHCYPSSEAVTEDGDSAVSAKIRKLRGEGYPQDQAVVIALNMQRRGEL